MKKNSIFASAALFILTSACSELTAQQLKTPAPSPLQTIKQAVGLSDITIEYSRPAVKGRVIYGDLVPFGKVWRTGANSSTKITFGDDAKVEGNEVKAGTYAVYSIPNKDSWDIMFYKDITLGGDVSEYKPENEMFRFKATPTALADKVESFTISFSDVTPKSTKVELLWEKTRVAFNITVEIDAKIMKNIETALEKDSRPYFQAANYYYENDKDLNKALEWVNKAFDVNPKAYWIAHLQAKIYMKMKNPTAAIAAAEKSKAIAIQEKSDDYVKLNDKLILEAKKK